MNVTPRADRCICKDYRSGSGVPRTSTNSPNWRSGVEVGNYGVGMSPWPYGWRNVILRTRPALHNIRGEVTLQIQLLQRLCQLSSRCSDYSIMLVLVLQMRVNVAGQYDMLAFYTYYHTILWQMHERVHDVLIKWIWLWVGKILFLAKWTRLSIVWGKLGSCISLLINGNSTV